ncbi:hypothetical protein RF11_07773 [Thelohanellus kitauei]|uniref:Tc1-like transposase DDE domain-containing protein n=1 Tax=Thelohanellus kitauei TaxID=669202 RepID=A0A0C2MQK0_THEKT|nr:hypothetical protein RF11_07773 [Thelohanellus kitauei]
MEKSPKGGNHRAKLTDEQKESLCDIVEEDCSLTIQRICDLFFERHNIRIRRSTATRCFKDFHCTLKNLRPIAERRNDLKNILDMKEYAMNFLRIAPHRQFCFSSTKQVSSKYDVSIVERSLEFERKESFRL